MAMQTCMGAMMKCSFGAAPSTLVPTPKTVITSYDFSQQVGGVGTTGGTTQ